jgi:glycosyltransferase involved in cell wall biosynthesis
MRIGVDARELSGHATGVGRYLQRLLQEWAARPVPHQWTLYSPGGRISVPPGLVGEVAVVPGGGGTRWEQGTLASALQADRPDVFFAPGYSAPLRAFCPVVVVMHDVSFAAHPEWYRWREGLRRRWLARQVARRARLVLTVSEFSGAEITRHLPVSPDRIRVIPHGIGLPAVGSAAKREPLILFVGSLFNRRHVPTLLQAFAQVARARHDVRLEIVGNNRTHPHQDIDALIRATGTASRIQWRGWVDDAELGRLYARASAFAFLSEYEGFGLTPLEALAAGVPPVVLDTPVSRETLGEAAIFVARPDAELVTEALHQALGAAPVRDQVLTAAPRVLGRYDWRRTAEATLAALEEAAGS